MYRSCCLVISGLIVLSGHGASVQAQEAAADTALQAVSYLDVTPAGRAATIAALKQYRDASRADNGYVRFDLLEQTGRPGHFVVLETWRDPAAFEAHGMTAHMKRFRDALQPVRVSGYDQRPYKTLSVAPARAAGRGAIHVVSHVDIGPGGGQVDAPAILRRAAEDSRQDAGVVRFDVVQHAMRANHFTVIEVWESQAALDAHVAAPHTRQYRDVVQPISGSPVDERVYTAVE